MKEITDKTNINGAEALAEIEVLLNRGDDISQEAMDLYEKYIGRKK